MKRIRFVDLRRREGEKRAAELSALGYAVDFDAAQGGALLGALKEDPPEAVVIDLSRSPAHGRDVAVALRIHGGTRKVPLVFLGGGKEKVDGVRQILPDAVFTEWSDISKALDRAFSAPVVDPVVPESALAGYSGTPLPKKLGIKVATQILLVGAPDGFLAALGSVPEGIRFRQRFGSGVDMILWFVRSRRELASGIKTWAPRVGRGGMWIIWPKKGSKIQSDLKQDLVRKTGLAAGLVDYKIAAVTGCRVFSP
jgi:hypothetical protein